jgi:hypothetical protein
MRFFGRVSASGLILIAACQQNSSTSTIVCRQRNRPFPPADGVYRLDLSKPGLAIPQSFLGFSNETNDMLNWTGT